MVVEDNDFTRTLVVALLRGIGVGTVREAAGGRQAFGLLGLAPVDLIICDLEMAPMSGLTFIRLLRAGVPPDDAVVAQPLDTTVPILVLTGHTSTEAVKHARAAGATAVLGKPINPKLIRQRIEAVIAEAARAKDVGLFRVIYCSALAPGVGKD
ncbi:response regulator, partial [bacterium]|nr:response regulator [bacterium]